LRGLFLRSDGQPATPSLDLLVGTLDYGDVRVATSTMGYKHNTLDREVARTALAAPNFPLKIIPHVDGSPRICELVEFISKTSRSKGPGPGRARCR
jgi:acetoacetate decarboxylase